MSPSTAVKDKTNFASLTVAERAEVLRGHADDAFHTWNLGMKFYLHGAPKDSHTEDKEPLKLTDADLRNVDLRDANIHNVNFRGSDLTGVKLDETLAIRQLCSLRDCAGVIVLPKGQDNLKHSILAIQSADGIKIFRTPHANIADRKSDKEVATILTASDRYTVRVVKAAIIKAGWEWNNDLLKDLNARTEYKAEATGLTQPVLKSATIHQLKPATPTNGSASAAPSQPKLSPL